MTLQVKSLTVEYTTPRGTLRALADVSFAIGPGEAYGLVGESGSGKTSAALSVVRYLPANGRIGGGTIAVGGVDVLDLAGAGLRAWRARSVAMVYQEPVKALNPTKRVGAQVAEAFAARLGRRPRRCDRDDVARLLRRVGFASAEQMMPRFPHQLSGGQAQRVVIAMALACEPELLILDEPTTGLDVRTEAGVLELVDELRAELSAAVLLISHDLSLVAARCDRVGVLRGGVLVEEGSALDVLVNPQHPYSKELVAAQPDLDAPKVDLTDRTGAPVALEAVGVRKTYGDTAVLDGVELQLHRGEVLALVGESGSGKTTFGRAVAGLTPHQGTIRIHARPGERRPVQIVFQNPDASLNPRRTVRQILSRSIRLLDGTATVGDLLERVRLDADVADRRPGELSGGQKQRVAIARAFAGPAAVVVCDEPVSSLDVSVQARILALLRELQLQTGMAYLFISHDLAVVRALADRVAVMHGGRIVESGPPDQIYGDPQHEYTRTLLHAARSGRPGVRVPEA